MGQFLKNHQLPRLGLHELDNLNGPIAIKEIEFVNSPKKRNTQMQVIGYLHYQGSFHKRFGCPTINNTNTVKIKVKNES